MHLIRNVLISLFVVLVISGCTGIKKIDPQTYKKENVSAVKPTKQTKALNQLEQIKTLVEQGVNIDRTNPYGESLLYLATKNSSLEIMKYLLEHGANVNLATNQGNTPLILAVKLENIHAVELLLSYDAYTDVVNRDGESPLLVAFRQNNMGIAEKMIQKNAKANHRLSNYLQKDGGRFLFDVADSSLIVTKFLIESGVNINSVSAEGSNALHIATRANKDEIVAYLLEERIDIESKNNLDETAIFIALKNKNLNLVKFLAEQGANVNQKNYIGESIFHLSIKQDNSDMAEYLLQHGADVNLAKKNEETPIFLALRKGNENLINMLIDKGANLNHQNDIGETPIYIALKQKNLELMKLLISSGADVNITKNNGESLLHLALKREYIDIVNFLQNKPEEVKVVKKELPATIKVSVPVKAPVVIAPRIESNIEVNENRKEVNKTFADVYIEEPEEVEEVKITEPKDIVLTIGRTGKRFYHFELFLKPENIILRPEFKDNGAFELFIHKSVLPVKAPNCREYVKVMMNGGKSFIEMKKREMLFNEIETMLNEGNGSVSVVVEVSENIHVLNENPHIIEMQKCRANFRNAFGRYIDYTGQLHPEDRRR